MHLSIITPTLNSATHIGEMLASVTAQSLPPAEHIVVDGGSTDGTRELLARQPGVRLIIHEGSSLYEALNTGLAAATGDIIGFLNSDDTYLPSALAIVAREFAADPRIGVLSGGAEVVQDLAGRGHRVIARYDAHCHTTLSLPLLTLDVPIFNARFFHRSIFSQVGNFDTRYRLAGDREFLIRLALADPPPLHRSISRLLYRYRAHAGSLTLSGNRERRRLIAAEHLALSADLLAQNFRNSAASIAFRRWHTREAVMETLRGLATGDWARLAGGLAEGRRYDARFAQMLLAVPFKWFLHRALGAIRRRNSFLEV